MSESPKGLTRDHNSPRAVQGCLRWALSLGVLGFLLWATPWGRQLLRSVQPEDDGGSAVSAADPAAAELAEQQRLLLEEERKVVRQQIRALHDERMEVRRQRIELLAKQFESGTRRQYDRIVLVNRCADPIDVTMYYLDLDDTWITRGWWGVPPGESVLTDAMTRNRYVYFYAENQNTGWFWNGAGRTADEVSLRSVVSERFDALDGEKFPYENPREVSFYRRLTPEGWNDVSEEFKCQVEAPLPEAEPLPSSAKPQAPGKRRPAPG